MIKTEYIYIYIYIYGKQEETVLTLDHRAKPQQSINEEKKKKKKKKKSIVNT